MNRKQILVQLSADDGVAVAPEWVLILPAGEQVGNMNGPPYLVDQAAVASVLKHFQEHQVDMVIDYEHQTQGGGEAPAAGWINRLEARADGIWGQVRWTERAKSYIEAREYRYLSPVFWYDEKTRRATCITEVGLTNTPAIHGIKPIVNKAKETTMTLLEKIRQLLHLDAGADEAQAAGAVEQAINSAGELRQGLCKSLGLEEAADDAAILKATGEQAAKAGDGPPPGQGQALAKVAGALGLAESAGEAEVIGTIAGLKAGSGQAGDLAAEVATLKANMAERDADEAVQAALKAGSIAPAQETWAKDYAQRDLAGFRAYCKAAPKVVPTGGLPAGKGNPVGELPDAETLAVCKAMGVTPETYAKYYGPDKEVH